MLEQCRRSPLGEVFYNSGERTMTVNRILAENRTTTVNRTRAPSLQEIVES
jgi:hypothetical protein